MALLKAAATGSSSPLLSRPLSFCGAYEKGPIAHRDSFISLLFRGQSNPPPATFEFCAREACQIFGGLAHSRGGQGEKIERLYRDAKAYRCVRFPLPLLFLSVSGDQPANNPPIAIAQHSGRKLRDHVCPRARSPPSGTPEIGSLTCGARVPPFSTGKIWEFARASRLPRSWGVSESGRTFPPRDQTEDTDLICH